MTKRCEACKQPSQHLIPMMVNGIWRRVCQWCAEDELERREAQKKGAA